MQNMDYNEYHIGLGLHESNVAFIDVWLGIIHLVFCAWNIGLVHSLAANLLDRDCCTHKDIWEVANVTQNPRERK